MDFDFYIYVGSKTMCNMISVGNSDSNLYLYDSDRLFVNYDNDNLIKSQNKLVSLVSLGQEYKDIYITHNPSYEVDYYPNENKQKEIEAISWLRYPLIKIENDKGAYFCSGKRSAIVKNPNSKCLFRLKGCGNLFNGFIKGKVNELGSSHYEIFGTQFKNTCLKEQLITGELIKRLKEYDYSFDIGNEPIGWWKYPNDVKYNELNESLQNDYSLIDKYCGIFTTKSDRRLGEHLFKGINLLLSFLFSDEAFTELFFSVVNLEELKTLLPSKNFNESEILFNDMILMDESYNEKLLFDLFDYIQRKDMTSLKKLEEEIINKQLNKFISESTNSFTIQFTKEIKNELQVLQSSSLSIIYLIIGVLSKIGYECGRIKKIMALMNFNWGTYDYHSNSHLDNFLVIPLNEKKNYLSPLDFDLAFFKKDFISIKYLNEKVNSN